MCITASKRLGAVRERTRRCRIEAGRQIQIEVVGPTSVYREQPEMVLYILDPIRIEEI